MVPAGLPLRPGTRRRCWGSSGSPVGGGHIVTHRCSIWVVADHWAIHALNTDTKGLGCCASQARFITAPQAQQEELRDPLPGGWRRTCSSAWAQSPITIGFILEREELGQPAINEALPGAPAATASALMSLGRTWSQQGSDTSPEEKSPGDECLLHPTERSMTMPTTSEQVGSPSRKVLPGGQEVMPSDMLPLLPLIPLFAWH